MPSDPLSTWPNERRWIWLAIAGRVSVRGPAFVENLQATRRKKWCRTSFRIRVGPQRVRGTADR